MPRGRLFNSFLPGCNASIATMDVYILAGQSNMAGRGGVFRDPDTPGVKVWDGVAPEQCRPTPGPSSTVETRAHGRNYHDGDKAVCCASLLLECGRMLPSPCTRAWTRKRVA